MTSRTRNPSSTLKHWTQVGSLMDRALQMLEPLGELTYVEFRRRVTDLAGSKDQAQAIVAEMGKRGFIEKKVRLTERALIRKRPQGMDAVPRFSCGGCGAMVPMIGNTIRRVNGLRRRVGPCCARKDLP